VDLTFDAVMEPWVTTSDGPDGPAPVHLDQLGRVTGTLELHGETLEVDCLAIRDRTWTLRSERWSTGGGYGYTNAAAATGEAFLAVGDERSLRGYNVADGARAALVSGRRHVERDGEHGYVTRIHIEGSDELGRALEAEGTPVSRMAMPIPGVHGLVWTTLASWTIGATPAWGEDQEPWPIAAWSARRRSRH
jgi:hypothetical protein